MFEYDELAGRSGVLPVCQQTSPLQSFCVVILRLSKDQAKRIFATITNAIQIHRPIKIVSPSMINLHVLKSIPLKVMPKEL